MIMFCSIADTSIPYRFRYSDTGHYLRRFNTNEEGEHCNSAVMVTEEEFAVWESYGNKIDGFAEFCLLCEQTSEYLLQKDRCIIHAVALSCGGRAFLVVAASGVGKSTLCKCLTDTWPEEISVINGDKPALQFSDDHGVIVYPSPWNGKEGWHGAEAAPLGGVFLLRRGSETQLEEAKDWEAAVKVYTSIFQSFTDESVIRASGIMTEHVLKSAPVWVLTSNRVQDTAELVYRKMLEVRNRDI